jgi:hypothetical protein
MLAGLNFKPSQIYLKFPLTLPLSPTGERVGVRGKMLEENSQI